MDPMSFRRELDKKEERKGLSPVPARTGVNGGEEERGQLIKGNGGGAHCLKSLAAQYIDL